MRPPKIFIFHPKGWNSQPYSFSHEGIITVNFSFEQILQKEDLEPEPNLILIWDTSKTEAGRNKLAEMKRAFPHVSLFLVAENPSPEYLMAAIKWQVSNFFQLPIEPQELQDAIVKALENQRAAFSLVQKAKNWFGNFQRQAQILVKSVSEPLRKNEQTPGTEGLGIVPHPFLPFFNKKLEQEYAYDIHVHFFGNLHIKIRGKTVSEIKGKKNATVLAYLLFNHHKPIHKDVIMEKFWSDVTPSSAKNSLNVAIYSLRKTLASVCKDEIILYENESYCINPGLEIITDIEKFTYYWKKGRSIESSQGLENALGAYNKAAALYQDDFLANIRFEEWCEFERDNLKEVYLFILNRLSVYFFEQKNYDACINVCRKMLDKDDCLEDVHRKLMLCYNLLGLNDLALKQYYKCEKILEKEFHLTPSESTRETFQKIKSGKRI